MTLEIDGQSIELNKEGYLRKRTPVAKLLKKNIYKGNSQYLSNNNNSLSIFQKLILIIAKFIIPSKAIVENNINVFIFYKPLWEEMLLEQHTLKGKIVYSLSILSNSVMILKNHYLFGDFSGLCLKQRLIIFINGDS